MLHSRVGSKEISPRLSSLNIDPQVGTQPSAGWIRISRVPRANTVRWGVCLLCGWLLTSPAEGASAPRRYPLMHFTPEQKAEISAKHRLAPQLASCKSLQGDFPACVSLLPHLCYVPAERNQGACGDCWQWAGTGVMEIALDVQNGIHDRLSVQLMNSCDSAINCCEGGWLENLASFYATEGFAVPWANTNAQFLSGSGSCGNIPCASIATTPRYGITSIQPVTIATHGVGQAQAIANIKAALNQNQAVWFAFYMSTEADWLQFFGFWDNQPETAVWTNFFGGQTPDDGQAGHAVLCVGYNDDKLSGRYWILVNSWGTTFGRTNGLFRVAMDLDYDCADTNGFSSLYWETLDLQFAPRDELPPAVAVGPASLNFGAVRVGTSTNGTFYVTNAGGGTLSGAATVSAPFEIVSSGNYSLGPGQIQGVVVQYCPTCPEVTNAHVTFTGGYGTTAVVSASAKNYYTLVLAGSPGCGGTISGSGAFPSGACCGVSAMTNSAYRFVNWTEGGKVVGCAAQYHFILKANRSLVANFRAVPVTYTVTTSSSPGNGGSTTGGGNFVGGNPGMVRAISARGCAFVNWTENGDWVSDSADYRFVVNGDLQLVANFRLKPVNYTVATSASPSNAGGTAGGGVSPAGSLRTVTAASGAGYAFANWTENGSVVSQSTNYTFTVQSNRRLLAHFIRSTQVPPGATFNGLFYETNRVMQGRSGAFTVTTTEAGVFSGVLHVGATRYPLTGQFNAEGTAQLSISNKACVLTVDLRVAAADADQIAGTISGAGWQAELTGDRAVFDAHTNAAPQSGRYTMVMLDPSLRQTPRAGKGTRR